MLTLEYPQGNRNIVVLVMGSFLFAIGLHQHLMNSKRTKELLAPSSSESCSDFESLPYDIMLHAIQYLDFLDVLSLQMTSKVLRLYAMTRPVYRKFSMALLWRNRALPLTGFQRIQDLSTEELIRVVTHGMQIERSWLRGTLSPTSQLSSSHYLRYGNNSSTRWYRVITTPGEEIDWFSPISSRFMLCASKSGRVICWDIQDNTHLCAWKSDERRELWKCRVEFELNQIYFIVAKIHEPGESEAPRGTSFVVMRLDLPEKDGDSKPIFSTLSSFTVPEQVMNVFMLDANKRLLAAFVYIPETERIGLYCMLDWDRAEFVFINTCIPCYFPCNWTCMLDRDRIVVHCEDRAGIAQHFYPLDILIKYTQSPTSRIPQVFGEIRAPLILKRAFLLPSSYNNESSPLTSGGWYPESAHFVRQWWPSLPSVPKLSCTVFLLAQEEPTGRPVKFVLAQHYFDVPILGGIEQKESNNKQFDPNPVLPIDDGTPIAKIWFISAPFEPVCEIEEEVNADGTVQIGKCRPLLAIDFGHAAWIEWVGKPDGTRTKELRFVSFPPVLMDANGVTRVDNSSNNFYGLEGEVEGRVHTLPVPDELEIDSVESINLDQSQGAILLSVKGGRVFILCYD